MKLQFLFTFLTNSRLMEQKIGYCIGTFKNVSLTILFIFYCFVNINRYTFQSIKTLTMYTQLRACTSVLTHEWI